VNRSPASNPFSTRFIRPGATTYRFPSGVSAATLAEEFLAQHEGRAAIVGPHGSGKTSLLYALAPYLGSLAESHLCEGDPVPNPPPPISNTNLGPNTSWPAQPLRLLWFRLMARGLETSHRTADQPTTNHSLKALMRSRPRWNKNTLLVVDGWEQIRWPLRGWIFWNAKRSQTKLLVTSHHKTILPTLWDSQVRPEIAQQVILDLLTATQAKPSPIPNEIPKEWERICAPEHLKEAIAKNRGSLREVLFNLYDTYEHTCRSDSQKGS
jgi:hypothetical protein